MILALMVFAFLGLIYLLRPTSDGLARFDSVVLIALRTPGDLADPLGPAWLTDTVVNVTSLGSNVVLALVALAVAGFLLVAGKRGAGALVLASAGGGAILSMVTKGWFSRPRPDVVAHVIETHTASFPSGHSLGAAATYLMLGLMVARFSRRKAVRIYAIAIAMILTLLVGLSRIYLGVHWPTDVLAGWLMGAAWAVLCWWFAGQLQRRQIVDHLK